MARNRRRLHARAQPHAGDAGLLADAARRRAAGADELIAAAEIRSAAARLRAELAEVQRAVVTLRMLDDVAGEDVARRSASRPATSPCCFTAPRTTC